MRRLEIYSSPEKFWNEVSPSLRREETKNSLLLGLAQRFRHEPADCLFQAALFSDDELYGAIVVSRYLTQHNLLLAPAKDDLAVTELFAKFRESGIEPHALIGEVRTADRYRALAEREGWVTKLNMSQGIYRCRKVRAPRASAKLREAELADIPVLAPWIEAFLAEAVPHDPKVDGVALALPRVLNKSIFVLEDAGRLISMGASSRDIGTSTTVAMIYTPPELRRRGYASALTAQLTQAILDQGKREVNLYTDLGNATSNKIYQEIGYEFVCDSVHYGVTRGGSLPPPKP